MSVRLSPDLAPPYGVQVSVSPSGERTVEIVSKDHVIASIATSQRHAQKIADFIVRACNGAVK